jgi:hypothetical protein
MLLFPLQLPVSKLSTFWLLCVGCKRVPSPGTHFGVAGTEASSGPPARVSEQTPEDAAA